MIARIKKWFNPPHVCNVFRNYYGMNIKQCEYCGKESPIGETHFIVSQR